MYNFRVFPLSLLLNHQRKADIDAVRGVFELPTNSKTTYA